MAPTPTTHFYVDRSRSTANFRGQHLERLRKRARVVPCAGLQATQLVSALEAAAARLGIAVRYDAMDRAFSPLQPGGGLCRLRGQPMILIDAKLSARERIAILARALGTFDLDSIYLPPLVRATIRTHGNPTSVLEPRPLARAKPNRRP